MCGVHFCIRFFRLSDVVTNGYDEERTCERGPESSEDKELLAVLLT